MTTTDSGSELKLAARNATLDDLIEILQTQRARALDVVVGATSMRARNGLIEVPGAGEATLTDDGVDTAPGLFRPMDTFDAGLAEKLPIGRDYLRWLRASRPDLYDANVNGLLHGRTRRGAGGQAEVVFPPMDGRFMLRLFRGDPGRPGVARALVSNRYRAIDSLDVLVALMDAINQARDEGEITGHPEIRNAQLTPDWMHVRVTVPDIAAAAPALTAGYRDPFRDGGARRAPGWQPPANRPRRGDVVWAGIDFRNNEIGGGALSITPMVQVCICDNGQVDTREAMRTVHVGARLEEGVIEWSDATRRKNLELVIAQARDAIRRFLSKKYLEEHVARLEQRAGVRLEDPAATITLVAKKVGFSQDQTAKVLNHFLLGGQATAAGVANAVTSAAQTVENPAEATALEDKALAALEAAADAAAAR